MLFGSVVIVLCAAVMIAPLFWSLWREAKSSTKVSPEEIDTILSNMPADGGSDAANGDLVGTLLNQNEKFLNSVRAVTCYPVLRLVHGFITAAAVLVLFVLWIVLLNLGSDTADRVYATLVCGLVIVVAVIEYGFFRMIVDAVDVLIDTGRRAAGKQRDGTAG